MFKLFYITTNDVNDKIEGPIENISAVTANCFQYSLQIIKHVTTVIYFVFA